MKPLKNDNGFSLVEVIASMLIVSIILAFAASFFFTGEKMFNNAIKGNTNKIMGDSVLNYYSDRLKFCSTLEIRNGGSVSNAKYTNVIWVSSANKIGFKTSAGSDANTYGDEFYGGNAVQIIVKPLADNCLSIQVRVMSADLSSELYSTSTVIKLLNMNIAKKSAELVGGATGTSFVNPVISFEKAS